LLKLRAGTAKRDLRVKTDVSFDAALLYSSGSCSALGNGMTTIVDYSTGLGIAALAIVLGVVGLIFVIAQLGKRFRAVKLTPPETNEQRDVGLSTQTLLNKTLQLNAKLEQRLTDVESRLHEHTENITDFMTEARTDGLTRLPNRRAIDDELNRRMTAWRQEGAPLFVALLDIDYFKKFNDRYGHQAGDAVLAAVARSLAHSARDGDFVGRLGGEEFAVIFALRDEQEAALAIERMRRVVEKTEVPFEGLSLRVTTSCGVSAAACETKTSELLKQADLALYSAKSDGRNCSHYHDGVRSRRVTPGDSGPASPSVTEPVSKRPNLSPVGRKHGLSNLMAELSRDLRHRLDELTRV
jgi:diguanylate cyclase (GGDEF)-like protein